MFQLESAYRPKRQRVKGENNPNTRQAVLFAGMNCLPGQENLFATDGQEIPPEHSCDLCHALVSRPETTGCGRFHPACAEKHAAECESCRRDYYPL